MLSWNFVDVIAMNNLAKWRIAASISVGLPENYQPVRVLSLRTMSSRYNSGWFMLFFCVWIVVTALAVVVLSRWRKGRRRRSQKIDDLARFSDCRSGTLAMLSSKLTVLLPMEVLDNAWYGSWKPLTDLCRHFERVICALLMWPPFFSGSSLHMAYYRMPW